MTRLEIWLWHVAFDVRWYGGMCKRSKMTCAMINSSRLLLTFQGIEPEHGAGVAGVPVHLICCFW